MKSKASLLMLLAWSIVTLIWWGIAFYPSPNSANWIQVARDVCFGVADNGLPQTYGWIMLVMAPLACLSVIVACWKNDLIQSFKQLHKSKLGLIAVPLILSFVLIEYTWVQEKLDYAKELKNIGKINTMSDFPDDYYQANKEVKDFKLIDQNGEQVSLRDFSGEIKILTFAFAHCQTVCPLLVTRALDAIKELDNVKLLIITLDPWRDTPRALPFLAKKWRLPSQAHVLSGEVNVVNDVIKSFGVPTKRSDKNGDIEHPAVTYIINGDNKISYILNNASTKWLKQAVQRIKTETVVARE